MYQTGYKGIGNINRTRSFNTGFCRLWFTPVENILAWPGIDPLTQFLSVEPTLKPGAGWYGPVQIPDKSSVYAEKLQVTEAGLSYKQQLSFYMPGDDRNQRINNMNLAWHEYVFIGLVRAGGYCLVIGSDQLGMAVTESEFNNNENNAAGTKLTFSLNSLEKAQVLTTFSLLSKFILTEEEDPLLSEDGTNIII